jgi:hypothetical protein
VPRELYHDSLIFFHADGRRRYVRSAQVSSLGITALFHRQNT